LRGGRGVGLDDFPAKTTKLHLRSPLHHAARGPPPPLRGGGCTPSFSRCGYRIRGLLHAARKPVHTPQITKGGGAPKGAYLFAVPGGARRAPRQRMLPSVRASGALALRRSTAVLAAPDASGHRLSPSPALPETRRIRALPSAACLSLPRSAETGRRAGRAVTRGRPGAVCETARGNRTCSTF
jgi:hypothetical protein